MTGGIIPSKQSENVTNTAALQSNTAPQIWNEEKKQ